MIKLGWRFKGIQEESFFQIFDQSLVHSSDEVKSVEVRGTGDIVSAMNTNRQVLCHFSVLDAFDCRSLQSVTELSQLREVIQLSSVEKSPSPSENTGNRVGRCFEALLMLTIVSCDSAVSSFSFDCSVRSEED